MPSLFDKLDRFTVGLLVSVSLGILMPCTGIGEKIFSHLSTGAIILLFFLYGAKLSRQAVWQGITHWRLQGMVALLSFIMFPLLGLLGMPLWEYVLGRELSLGLLYVCVLPSTVQSSIAFTSIAGGNVAAAICAASISSLLGVFLTPMWVGLLWGASGSVDLSTFLNICYIILVPFVLGQIAQCKIGTWVTNHRTLTSWTDHSTIWLVIYTAFSHAMSAKIWHGVPWYALVGVVVCCAVLLAVAMCLCALAAKKAGFTPQDRIVVIFCGSKKSLATGIPMMNVIFAGSPIGLLMIPLMIYHQLQLMLCSVLAKRWAKTELSA